MITLQNKLYESLLDDEDDLINTGDENITKDLANKIFGSIKYNIENNENPSYFGILSTALSTSKDVIKNIFSGEYLTHFKRFSSIFLNRFSNLYNYFKRPVYIDKIDHLYVSSDSLLGFKSGDINIKEITELEVNVGIENEKDWMDVFQNTKIKTLLIRPSYSNNFNMKNIPPISGLNANKLIIANDMVPGYEPGFLNKMDWSKIDEYINFIKSNNKIKNIYIIDVTESTRVKFCNRYIKIKKII